MQPPISMVLFADKEWPWAAGILAISQGCWKWVAVPTPGNNAGTKVPGEIDYPSYWSPCEVSPDD